MVPQMTSIESPQKQGLTLGNIKEDFSEDEKSQDTMVKLDLPMRRLAIEQSPFTKFLREENSQIN